MLTGRISAISWTIVTVAIISGFYFINVDDLLYEPLNGPPLVTPKFIEDLAKNSISTEKFEICETNNGSKGFLILSINRYPNLYFATHARKINDNKYKTHLYFVPEPGINHLSKEADEALNEYGLKEFTFKLNELNRVIDKRHFPDPATRAVKKQKILNRLSNPSSITLNEL